MKILLLAPQPFFQERGTPIAVKLASEAIGSRNGLHVEVLCYPEGQRVAIPNVLIRRVWTPRILRGIRPGISIKKILSDCFMCFFLFRLLWRRRRDQYALIHAVEESVFFALMANMLFGIPYIYDMDSFFSRQLVERWTWLKPLRRFLENLESLAARKSLAVIAVCNALVKSAKAMGSRQVFLLSDVSLLEFDEQTLDTFDIRKECSIEADIPLVLYVGNLESYQGIDLLLNSFALCCPNETPASAAPNKLFHDAQPRIERHCGRRPYDKLRAFDPEGRACHERGPHGPSRMEPKDKALGLVPKGSLPRDRDPDVKKLICRGASLVLVGGRKEYIDSYSLTCANLGIDKYVHFLGPKPVTALGSLLSQADILVSPRISGCNTPMKIYSYLHAGKALLATDLETHTQVLNNSVCRLAEPSPEVFAEALQELIKNPSLRDDLAAKARQFAEESFTIKAFRKTLNAIYDQIEQSLRK